MKKWFLVILGMIFFITSGCATSSGEGVGGGSVVNKRIPMFKESAPAGILEQLTWGGSGGDNDPTGSCYSCSFYWQDDTLVLSNFEPYQNLLLVFYEQSGGDGCGNHVADYRAGIDVQTDSQGYLEVNISGLSNKMFLYEIYDNDTGYLQIGFFLGGSYSCR